MNELLVVPEEHGIYHCQCPDHLNMFATLKCRMAVVVALKDTKCRRETYFSTLAVSHNIRIGVSAVPHKIPSITTAIDRNTQDSLARSWFYCYYSRRLLSLPMPFRDLALLLRTRGMLYLYSMHVNLTCGLSQ